MSIPDLFRILQVVFGIGLVIFVHEAGHFIAARMCGVRVDVFSLGFGPRLFAWRRGATVYQIAAFPIGGYVRMAGEMPDEMGDGPRDDELASKNVWQRFFIYSGGVLMNVVFALLVFPIVLFSGVPTSEPIVVPDKGSPAWKAGLPAGAKILQVDGAEVYDFFHIPNEVALAGDGPIEFIYRPPGAEEHTRLEIEPVYNDQGGFRQIGVRPGVDPELRLVVDEEGPAWKGGLRPGDRLLGVVGSPESLEPYAQLVRAIESAEAFELLVAPALDPGTTTTVRIDPVKEENERRILGVAPLQNVVESWRQGNPSVLLLDPAEGERLISIDGHPVAQGRDVLEALAAGAAPDWAPTASQGSGPEFVFEAPDGGRRVVRLPVELSPAEAVALDASIHLDYDEGSTRVIVQPERAAAMAGLRTGDRLLAIGVDSAQTWQEVFALTREASSRSGPVAVAYERQAENGEWVRQEAVVDPLPLIQSYYGFAPEPARGIYRTESLAGSITAGVDASWRFMTDAWLTLKKMLTAEVSTENLGGIITISSVSYSFAADGWAKLFFFLCMLSINLAFINVLPIPVLDGGHLFFCLVEAIKGSPVSERTLGYSQVVGLVLILTLMVYVTYQDVMRILLIATPF